MSNLLKSIYISAYVTLLMVASAHAAIGIWTLGVMTGWSAVALAVWPMMFFFVRIFLTDVVRTSANLAAFQVLSWAGVLLVPILGWGTGDFWLQCIYALGVGGLGVTVYVYWYSRFQRDSGILKVGAQLPAFELEDEEGVTVSSSLFMTQPSLLIFYRGNWCPLCMAQVKEISAQYQALDALGVMVALISPQPHSNTRGLADKFNVPFKFLVDAGNKAAKTLGIDAKSGTPKGMEVLGYDSDTVMPTVLITNNTGKIIFADLTDNYRVRPEPETFIQVLKEHGVA